MSLHVHGLTGCQPTPLASYLKAMGVLRLVSQQADPDVRGFWRSEHFWIVTKLDLRQLEQFLLHDYAPTPLVAPWNGGSGFYPTTSKAALEQIAGSPSTRFAQYRQAIALCTQLSEGLSEAPKNAPKFQMQRQLLRQATGTLGQWMAAVLVIDTDGEPAYPALLGTGGNDGRLDFTNNFMQRLVGLFDCAQQGAPPRPEATAQLQRALWNAVAPGQGGSTMGQFDPGSVSGANFGNGFHGKSVTNPWDFVLLLEGTLALAASATRRLAAHAPSRAAAPFAVLSSGSGYASASAADEGSRGEQWFPMWSAPASYGEVQSLFAEGRATLDRHSAKGAMDFARAISRLGVARGIDAFERYGYIERNGQANLATPLGRWRVQARPHQQLIDEVDGWIQSVRRAGGAKGAPAAFERHGRALQAAILNCCQHGRTRDWQRLWFALGAAEAQFVHSPKFSAERNLRPLPPLSAEWVAAIDDGSPTCRLALALAFTRDSDHPWGLRRHWLPMVERTVPRFATNASCLALGPMQVARSQGADDNLTRVLLKRVQLARSQGASRLGLQHTGPGARLADVAAWVQGEVDGLSLGAWLPAAFALARDAGPEVRKRLSGVDGPTRHDESADDVMPLFALLRLAVPHGQPIPKLEAPRLDPTLISALHAGRPDRAAAVAIRRLRAAGHVPLLQRATASAAQTDRLLSAMLFPLDVGPIQHLGHVITHVPSDSQTETVQSETAPEASHDC